MARATVQDFRQIEDFLSAAATSWCRIDTSITGVDSTAYPEGGVEMDTESASISSDERTMAVLSHVAAFLGYVVPFGQLIAPYVMLLLRRDESDFVVHHARESLNFQITITISLLVALVLTSIWIGYLLLPAILVYSAVMVLVAASRASRGELYTYPLALRPVQ